LKPSLSDWTERCHVQIIYGISLGDRASDMVKCSPFLVKLSLGVM
jgi:hypothetical protein